ncbi:MAG TPA: sulfocyanin-like copper-binding protein, partial [Chthoniobacteraceae bacterium]|nr:sulfocyanin-like copper-binding protein [Chthoniobacteraceae bacterium]
MLSTLAGFCLAGRATAADGTVHDPAAHPGAGLHKELIAGITEADFLKLGPGKNVVSLTLVAAFTDANQGMNLNGYHHGKAVYVVPKGWTVEVTFINPSPVPHSVVVVEAEKVRAVRVGEPAFKGASTPDPVLGTSAAKVSFHFVADEEGDFALACGIPIHATAGHF